MKLTVIGAGNIGLVTALCFAEKGHQVCCIDIDQTKISKLKSGVVTIFEPELEILLTTHLKNSNIQFSSQIESVINHSDIIFVAVGTPNNNGGQVDLTAVEAAVANISKQSSSFKTIIIKSTVPPNTCNRLSEKYPKFKFISSPEFLREGSAIYDCLNPDRIVIGSVSDRAADLELFKKIYEQFNLNDKKYVQMDSATAEMTKYASNIFLASRISLINELSRVCEKSGANIELLKLGLGLDRRIGPEFLNAGIGYGGSCLPKDIEAFLSYAATLGENLSIAKAIKETNDIQIKNFAEKIINYFASPDKTSNEKNMAPTICLWGVAFKPETDDLREAPALKLIQYLKAQNFKLHIYDPEATAQLKKLFQDDSNIQIFTDSYKALQNTEALVICTEWNEFKNCDLIKIKTHLKRSLIFDGRNIFDSLKMIEMGFEYFSVGRN